MILGIDGSWLPNDRRPTTHPLHIPSPPSQINPRNHHFAIAGIDEGPHFRDHALCRQRAALPSNVRNHAERAAIVASILHLKIWPRALIRRFKYRSRQQFGVRKNVAHKHLRLFSRKLPQNRVPYSFPFFAKEWALRLAHKLRQRNKSPRRRSRNLRHLVLVRIADDPRHSG